MSKDWLCESHPGVWVESWCIVARRVAGVIIDCKLVYPFDIYAHNCPRWVCEQIMRGIEPAREPQLVPYVTAKSLIRLLNG